MPVLVDPKTCLNREVCFAANACPYNAFFHNSLKRTWEVDATVCGDCPGPCINFCDQDALRWGDDLIDLKIVKSGLEGEMSREQVLEARAKHKRELAEAARKKETLVELTTANFEAQVLKSNLPVVVDCWAAWCGPCKQFSPVFEAAAKHYEGAVKFAKLDTDAQPTLARALGVQALPTVLLFYKGQLVNAAEGALPAAQFQTWLYQTLAVIRQHEAQFAAEAEEMVDEASQRMSTLSGQTAGSPTADEGGSGLILDTHGAPPTLPSPPSRSEGEPGRQTTSGLYIP